MLYKNLLDFLIATSCDCFLVKFNLVSRHNLVSNLNFLFDTDELLSLVDFKFNEKKSSNTSFYFQDDVYEIIAKPRGVVVPKEVR